MSHWNGWRVLAVYRRWFGWVAIGLAFAGAWHLGWVDGVVLNQVGAWAERIIIALTP